MATRFTKPVRLRQVSAQAEGTQTQRIVPSPDWCDEEPRPHLAACETLFATELAVVAPTLLDVEDVVPAPNPTPTAEIPTAEGRRRIPLAAVVFLAFLLLGFGAGFTIGMFSPR
ncbi:MAG: hypothetical protein U0792_15775 [Gemmataceae bacterium]